MAIVKRLRFITAFIINNNNRSIHLDYYSDFNNQIAFLFVCLFFLATLIVIFKFWLSMIHSNYVHSNGVWLLTLFPQTFRCSCWMHWDQPSETEGVFLGYQMLLEGAAHWQWKLTTPRRGSLRLCVEAWPVNRCFIHCDQAPQLMYNVNGHSFSLLLARVLSISAATTRISEMRCQDCCLFPQGAKYLCK